MIFEILVSALVLMGEPQPGFEDALSLYRSGMYQEAERGFSQLEDNALNDGYELLCVQKQKISRAFELFQQYRKKYSASSVLSQILLEQGRLFFDEGDYSAAKQCFEGINEKGIEKKDIAELSFKKGFCNYQTALYPDAQTCFLKVLDLPYSPYVASSQYYLGLMSYSQQDFSAALEYFKLAGSDKRFEQLSAFYILECKFLCKDYDYVISNAESMLATAPESRREHLARLLSESYLVKGNTQKARDFYDMSYHSNLSRADFFYGGSVLYAFGDYQGAIDNFTRMEDRTDSLGQIANYQLANAYLKTHNRVLALDSFKAASLLSFDPVMQEDAYLNYAKLAFDINHDNSGFAGYIKKYSTSKRGEQIYGYMALAALNSRDYAAAVEAYDNIDELDADMRGNYMKANFLRGAQLYNSGAYKDAIPCLRAASFYLSKQDRFNQLCRFWLAQSYYKTDNFKEAEDLYSSLYNLSALQNSPEGNEIPYNLAYSLFNQGDFLSASRWFDKYLGSSGPVHGQDAMLRRADCDFLSKDYKAAIGSYQKAIDAQTGGLYPYLRQALSYGLTKDRKNKILVLEKAVQTDPSTALYDDCLYELGRSYMDSKRTKDALASFHKLRENTSDSSFVAKALIGLGMVNRNGNNLDQALDCYKEVVSIMPGSDYAQDALLAIESIYQAKKQPHKYLEYVEGNSLLSAKSDQDKELIYFGAAEQLYLAGDYAQAISSLQKYMDNYPQGFKLHEAWFYVAESQRALGNKEKACESYSKALELQENGSYSELSRSNFAQLSFELEHFVDAYNAYASLAQTAKLEANVPAAHLGMMKSAYKARNYEAAAAAAQVVEAESAKNPEQLRLAQYIEAKSLLASSKRAEALSVLKTVSLKADDDMGAEASCILIQDMFDRGDFDAVEKEVYRFTEEAGAQSYWLAKAFVILGDSFAARAMKDQAKATFESVRDGYEPYGPEDDILQIVNSKIAQLN